jgi:hypothetical protein
VSVRIVRGLALSIFMAYLGVACSAASYGSASRPLPTPSSLPTTKAETNTATYSGAVQLGSLDAGRAVTVIVGTEVDVLYPTAVSVANEDQAAGAVVWIGFRPGLVTRFKAISPGHAQIIPTGSCPGMNCPSFELTINVQDNN